MVGGGGRGPVGAGVGAVPFSFGASIEDVAMSSNLEVAASSLWIIAVSSVLETVGKTLSSMIARADQQAAELWEDRDCK